MQLSQVNQQSAWFTHMILTIPCARFGKGVYMDLVNDHVVQGRRYKRIARQWSTVAYHIISMLSYSD